MHLSIRLVVVAVLLLNFVRMLWDARHGGGRPAVIGLVMVAAGILGILEFRAQAAEQRFGMVASEIAGRSVSVRCEGFFGRLTAVGPELGTVRFNADGTPADRTDLVAEACDDLKRYAGGDHRPRVATATAVHVLAHEAIHLLGVQNEAETECRSLQHTTRAAMLLGANRRDAKALTGLYWRAVYPNLPAAYRTPDCRDGGPFDENPASAEFP